MLETERLYLKQWQKTDFEPFAEMNSDKEVMRYFPKVLSSEESDAMALGCQSLIEKNGWGFWAVSLKDTKAFIGFVGLYQPHHNFPFSPCIEIAWRLRKEYWGYGYATEAANAALKFAFEELKLKQVVSFTACSNRPSQRVMERIGMTNKQEDFFHPAIEENHPLAKHVLYKITQTEWRFAQTAAEK